MKRVIIAVLLIFGWVAIVEAAPRGKAFLHGMQTPAQLAGVIENSLAHNSSGDKMISSAQCRDDASCAAPVDYLKMLQEADPDARLANVSELPEYLRSLEARTAPSGKYWMACLRADRSSSTGYTPLLHCVSRAFKLGEKAWFNPRTGRLGLAQNCTNPVEKPEVPVATRYDPCVYIRFSDATFTAVRLKQYGPANVASDECTALKRAGETDWESPFVEKCPDDNCNFIAVDQALGEQGFETGSFAPVEHGVDVLRLPAKFAGNESAYRIVFCVDRGSEHSCGMGVQWFDFVPEGNTKIATIYSDEIAAVIAQAKTVSGRSTNLWWRFGGECY